MLGLLRHRLNNPSIVSPLHSTFNSSIYRLLSTASPTPSSEFAVQYLINSCGLPSDKALRASKYFPHVKSPEKPDAVLRFLRQAGITESHINTAASRDPRFLGFSVDKCLEPRVAEMRQLGFSQSDISLLISVCPRVLSASDFSEKIRLWLSIFGSLHKLLLACRRNFLLLLVKPETSVLHNVSFLKEQCGLSVCQIARLILYAPRFISCKPEALEIYVKRADDFGVLRSSGMFMYALVVTITLGPSTIEAKLRNLKNLGFSQDDVTSMIRKSPTILKPSEKSLRLKMEFLVKEMDGDISPLVRNPDILHLSLEKRMIPRTMVRKLLKSKGLPAGDKSVVSFLKSTDDQFLRKFVRPYENTIPGLQQALKDACAGKLGGY